jgi:rhodanese-related sulfurtransferase
MAIAFRQMLAILTLALLPALAAGVWHPRRPAWQSDEVTVAAAIAWDKDVLWVDARPDEDFARAHIPGAVPLNEDHWDDQLNGLLDAWNMDTQRKIVVYCSSLSCQLSQEVADRLRDEEKMPNVFVLQGGWESWQAWAASHPQTAPPK